MAVTAPAKKIKPAYLAEAEARDRQILTVIEVTRDWLDAHPPEEVQRSWGSLVDAAVRDPRVVIKTVTWGDMSCSFAWSVPVGHAWAALQDRVWFRQGADGRALLYQQAWRGPEQEG